jgi:hypothetical protein
VDGEPHASATRTEPPDPHRGRSAVTAVSRFRLFGRPPEDAPSPAPPAGRWAAAGRPTPPPAAPGSAPFGTAADSTGAPATGAPRAVWADGPATRAARPAGSRRYAGDPPTNPFGYPPVAGPPAGARPGAAAGSAGPAPYPDRAEATALAGAFAVDYLSWDEEDPARRGRALAEYLPAAAADPAELGWAGQGRQRAEFVLPGRVRPDGEGRVLVDVRVRVTPYRPVGRVEDGGPAARPGPPAEGPRSEIVGTPAAAPAPTAPGWRSLASQWVRLTVPVVLDGDRLLVDAWEELIGGRPKPPPARRPDDHQLDEDEPVAEPVGGVSR